MKMPSQLARLKFLKKGDAGCDYDNGTVYPKPAAHGGSRGPTYLCVPLSHEHDHLGTSLL